LGAGLDEKLVTDGPTIPSLSGHLTAIEANDFKRSEQSGLFSFAMK
jgi:hypothetical protein